ncbi:MAG: hypothetical protein M5U27_07900 [Gaiella sp.]|nr:hypothetical protein [Gaiella sp.]
MVREEIQVETHDVARDPELGYEEPEEEANHRRVGVREVDRVPRPRALGPVQHASRHVKRLPGASTLPTLGLPRLTAAARTGGVFAARFYTIPSIVPAHSARCSSVSWTSRTQRLTDDGETRSAEAISFTESPSERIFRARLRSLVFTIDNVARRPDGKKKAACRARTGA